LSYHDIYYIVYIYIDIIYNDNLGKYRKYNQIKCDGGFQTGG